MSFYAPSTRASDFTMNLKGNVVCDLMSPLSLDLNHRLDLKDFTSWFSLPTAGEAEKTMPRRKFTIVSAYTIETGPRDAMSLCRGEQNQIKTRATEIECKGPVRKMVQGQERSLPFQRTQVYL